MTRRTIAMGVWLTLLGVTPADARRRVRHLQPRPSPPPPARDDTSPDDLPEPLRNNYQVLHAFGKA